MTCGQAVHKPVDNRIQLRITPPFLWILKKIEIRAPERLRHTWLQE
jgi:hypothetical protein